jgi:hypothetical protein
MADQKKWVASVRPLASSDETRYIIAAANKRGEFIFFVHEYVVRAEIVHVLHTTVVSEALSFARYDDALRVAGRINASTFETSRVERVWGGGMHREVA